MKVLVIGSGGREHALCWKLAQSKRVTRIFCAPGNPGIAEYAQLVPIAVDQIDKLCDFARGEAIDLTIVGPELPLTLGVVDLFKQRGLPIFGPSKAAAQIEGSKDFAKKLMVEVGIPTAKFGTFTDLSAAQQDLKTRSFPTVVKADGLCAGKGVMICQTNQEAEDALRRVFGELKNSKVVIEDFLSGEEVSYIVATDGKQIIPMASSHDYKRLRDGDDGPNTGGMGSVSPTPRLSAEQEAEVIEKVMRPAIEGLAKRGTPFSGFLYAGLMLDPKLGTSVLEFNARMGDPECQSVMRRMKFDLFELLLSLATGDTPIPKVEWDHRSALCIVQAAAGYPDAPRGGDEISGLSQISVFPAVAVFHAGTALKDGKVVTNGGRVLSVTSLGESLEAARLSAYKAADMIQFKGIQFRRDIGR